MSDYRYTRVTAHQFAMPLGPEHQSFDPLMKMVAQVRELLMQHGISADNIARVSINMGADNEGDTLVIRVIEETH